MQHGKNFFTRVLTIGLTIFAMLFGAGNLIFPPKLGIEMGQYTWLGFLGFFLSAVVLPMIGLLAIVSFEGDYREFFGRLKYPLGDIFIFLCMLIVGPILTMPRIVMTSYAMMYDFLPFFVTPTLFALGFSALAFLVTYRPSKLLDIVGKFLSPLKITSIVILISAGLFYGIAPEPVATDPTTLFWDAFTAGYATLDILGAIFFGAIIVHLLTKYVSTDERLSIKEAMKITAFAAIFAGFLLGTVYLGMLLLGAYHGHGLDALDQGAILRIIALRVLGTMGGFFIAGTVFLACFTTIVSLSAVVGEYVYDIIDKRLTYAQAVGSVLLVCTFIASAGLKNILSYSMPFIMFFYPLIVVIVFCNLAYKLFDFKPITGPVIIMAVILIVYKLINIWS